MNLSNKAFKIIKSTYKKVMRDNGLSLNPKEWPEDQLKQGKKCYIYFNDISFMPVFPTSKCGDYTDGKNQYSFRAKLPVTVVRQVADKINSLFKNSNPLVPGGRLTARTEYHDLVNILSDEGDSRYTNKLVKNMMTDRTDMSPMDISLIGEKGEVRETHKMRLSNKSLKMLGHYLTEHNDGKGYKFDLSNDPELLESIRNLGDKSFTDRVKVMNRLFDSNGVDRPWH